MLLIEFKFSALIQYINIDMAIRFEDDAKYVRFLETQVQRALTTADKVSKHTYINFMQFNSSFDMVDYFRLSIIMILY